MDEMEHVLNMQFILLNSNKTIWSAQIIRQKCIQCADKEIL